MIATQKRTVAARILGLLVVTFLLIACGSEGGRAGGPEARTGNDTDVTESAAAEQTFDCDDLVGVWIANELSGGAEEIGGIYRATLTLLPSGEVQWSVSDYIEVWSSWTCVGTEIIGFSDSSVRWVSGQPVALDPNPCTDFTTSAPRRALPGETLESASNWVRCRSGKLEEGVVIAKVVDDDTVRRNNFTLNR